MKVFIQNKGETTLTKNNFLSSGGEGQIYVKGNIAYKIYIDVKKMIPVGKISELSDLESPNIIKPIDLLLNNKNNYIGYTMNFVSNTYSFCQLFTKSFKERNNINQDNIIKLVINLKEIVEHVHSKKILIVDLNEMNFLVNNTFDKVYAIDVDSYQTKHYPATALMESVRDRHCKNNKFNEGTDWFSFAIISFQAFINIHPYKGNHKLIKSLDERMIKNISVFNKDVLVPKVCNPLDSIPENLKNWYKAVFENGLREAPPSELHAAAEIIRQVQKITGSDNFDIKELQTYIGNIIDVIWEQKIVSTTEQLSVGKAIIPKIKDVNNIYLPKTGTVISAFKQLNKLKLKNSIKQKDISLDLDCKSIMKYDNRLYLQSKDAIIELKFTEIGQNILASPQIVAQVLENATNIFDGVIIQNLLGAIYVSIFPQENKHIQFRIKELENCKIIDAKFDFNVLMVIGVSEGKYNRFIFRLDSSYNGEYDVRIINDITYSGLNFIVNDRGICISITENEELEIFSNKKDSSSTKLIKDPIISGDMKLFKSPGAVLFSKNNKLFSLKMK